jgi:flagellin
MSVTINTNIPSIAASRSLHETSSSLNQAMERLSSGKRINGAKDDAAGMTVVTRMKAQITSLSQAVRNANDAISMISTYDGAADEIETILIRMHELATLAQNGTYTDTDRDNANLEYQALKDEVNRIHEKTKFNGTLALGGSEYSFQIGFTEGEDVAIGFNTLSAATLFGAAVGGVSTIPAASGEVPLVSAALTNLNAARAEAGSLINRLEHTVSNLMNVIQRTEEARSRIEDADFAMESAALAKANVLTQAGSAMLAQANQAPQYALALLRT